MKKKARLAGVCMTMLVAAGSIVEAPGSAGAVTLRNLKGLNVIEATKSSTFDVRLPRDATVEHVPFGKNRSIRVFGAGRLIGLVLVRQTVRARDPVLASGVFRPCDARACESPITDRWQSFQFTDNLRERGGKVLLPAGAYRLYVLADGAPVRVELRLDGLNGTADWQPAEAARVRVTSPDARVHTDPLGRREQ